MEQYPNNIEKGIAESLQLITAVPPSEEKITALTDLYRESLDYYQNDTSGLKLITVANQVPAAPEVSAATEGPAADKKKALSASRLDALSTEERRVGNEGGSPGRSRCEPVY